MRCEQEIAAGVYLLDALEPDEQLRMRQHVETCAVCAQTVCELSGVAGVLAVVEPAQLRHDRAARTTPQRGEFAFQRSWRALAVAAAAVVVVGGAAAAGGVVAISAGGQPPSTTLTAQADGMSAHAKVVAAGSGSLVTLTLNGLPIGDHCRLVAVGRDGDWSSTHTWAVTRPGPLTWTGTIGVPPADLDHLAVVAADGRTLVTLPVRAGARG